MGGKIKDLLSGTGTITKKSEKNPEYVPDINPGMSIEEIARYKGTYTPWKAKKSDLHDLQTNSEVAWNTAIGFGKGIGSGLASGIGNWDITSTTDKQQHGNFFTILSDDINENIKENNPIYEQIPGSYNPSDGAWRLKQVQGIGYYTGIILLYIIIFSTILFIKKRIWS